MTYQQAACPVASEERKVDATPANPDYDPAGRERLLKQGEEAGRRLEARSAKEEEERRRREEQRRIDEERERETRAREEYRDYPAYVYGWPGIGPRPPIRPPPPPPNRPTPKPTVPAPAR